MNEQASQLLQTGKNEKHFSCQLKKGCKPIYGLYPDMVNCVTNFLKQNSFTTERRRNANKATGTGVALEQIRIHV